MFFQSAQHQGCLQKIELAIRLKRGLSVVIGDIGTGKSTLSRQLVRLVHQPEGKISTHLLLDPEFTSPLEFLGTITKLFAISKADALTSEWQMKDLIKNYLFEQAIQKGYVPVLIIDEGQKLPGFCIEILREFLNFETNKHKLLQIVIFAQKEFTQMLQEKPNFADRITTLHHLVPLSYADTKKMIGFRLQQAGNNAATRTKFFSPMATLMIYLVTKGSPRKIVMLCSKCILAILIKNKKRSGLFEVISGARETTMFSTAKILTTCAIASFAVSVISAGAYAGLNIYGNRTNTNKTYTQIPHQQIQHLIAAIQPAAPGPIAADTPQVIPLPPEIDNSSTMPPLAQESAQTEAVSADQFDSKTYSKIPDILGILEFDSQSSLSRMIARIYGRYKVVRLQMVLEHNPQIVNPDLITAGTLINFPKSPTPLFTPSAGDYWVELTRSASLAGAYSAIKTIPRTCPPVLIAPRVDTTGQMVFMIVVDANFSDKVDAESTLRKIPEALRKSATIRRA